jgi:hypothetical protein
MPNATCGYSLVLSLSRSFRYGDLLCLPACFTHGGSVGHELTWFAWRGLKSAGRSLRSRLGKQLIAGNADNEPRLGKLIS